MIGLGLALKSIVRQPRRHVIAVLGVISVLVPLMLMWGMKVGFMSGLMAELRSAPSNLELRLRGDYLIDDVKLAEIKSISGVGFVIPTARMLATRAFVSQMGGGRRTPGSLMPTGDGDPLLKGAAAMTDNRTAMISQSLADRLGVREGGMIELVNSRRDQTETLRLPLQVAKVLTGDGISGQWVFVTPDLVQAMESFIDGYALPEFGIIGRPPTTRATTYSGLRIYAGRIEHVARVARALERMDFTVESNAVRIENVLKLDRVLNAIVLVLSSILLAGLCLSVWAGLSAILEQMKRHVALLGLMGAGVSSAGLYFVGVGFFVATLGTLGAILASFGLMTFGNRWLEQLTVVDRPVFAMPLIDAAGIVILVFALQAAITLSIAARAATIRPQEMLLDD